MSAEKLAVDVLEEISSLQEKKEIDFTFDEVYEKQEEVKEEVSLLSTYSKQSKRALQEESNFLMKELFKTMLEVRSELTDVNSKVAQVTTKVKQIEDKQIIDKNELPSTIARNTLDPNTILLATNLLAEDSNRSSNNVTNRDSKNSKKAKVTVKNPTVDNIKNSTIKEDSSTSGSDVSEDDSSSSVDNYFEKDIVDAKTRRLTASMYHLSKEDSDSKTVVYNVTVKPFDIELSNLTLGGYRLWVEKVRAYQIANPGMPEIKPGLLISKNK